ncbi:hypothetical protein MauCBS54593_000703 [Microsporum audouinii]
MFTAWLPSCSWCIWSEVVEQAPPPQVHNDTNKHEGTRDVITVCADQPRPVAPMKLVLYEDIPSSPRVDSRYSLLPTLVTESRSLASRASNRASVLLKNKKKPQHTSARKLNISGPTDFRHLTARSSPIPRRRRQSFRPLELSIYAPGNQLPDLPAFESFGLDNFSLEIDDRDSSKSSDPAPDSTLALPPKAVCPSERKDDHQRSESSPLAVSRKPVGTTSVRNSLYIEVHDRRHTMPDPEKFQNIQNSLYPPRMSCETLNGYPLSLDDLSKLRQIDSENPLPCINSSRGNSSYTPTPTHHLTRSRTITEWFSTKPYHNRPTSSFRFDVSPSRARTLSGSTMVSLANASTGGYSSRNHSLSSSVIMSTNTQSPLTFHTVTEKDYEVCDLAMGYKTTPREARPTTHARHQPRTTVEKESFYNIPLGPNDIGVAY